MECVVSRGAVRFGGFGIGGGVAVERQRRGGVKESVFVKSRSVHSKQYGVSSGGYGQKFVKPVISCRAVKTTLDAPATEDQESAPGRTEFLEAAQRGNLVPVYRRIFADHLTPVLAYRCLVKEDDRDAPSFLFESVENGKNINMGRYSMVGAQPSMEIIAKEDRITVLNHEKGTREEKISDDPMNEPSEIASKWEPVKIDDLPDVFCGGWVGYFSYDTVRYVEKKKIPFSSAPKDDRGLPDIHLGLYNDVLVFDHVTKLVYVLHWVHVDQFDSPKSAFKDGNTKLDLLVARLQAPGVTLSSGLVEMSVQQYSQSIPKSNFAPKQFKDAILQVKEHILAGDIFQLVLSQRFERRTFADPFEVYRALRIVNPSPYMIYLQARGSILVASSPEILTRIAKRSVVNRPLAGTRRRGRTPEEDVALEKDLLADEKECAEHVMLVDLGRNDVGKVSKAGTVKVEKLMEVERYSHVMHISSTVLILAHNARHAIRCPSYELYGPVTKVACGSFLYLGVAGFSGYPGSATSATLILVTGELLDELSSWDALRAALPVGTVSGAPKVRAMELIDELEPTRRGPYSGGIGGVSFTGQMDIALALRTMVFPTQRNDAMYSYRQADSRREWVVHLQAGAGIVADSDPESEFQETVNKSAGLARAIDLAEAAFVETDT